MDALWRPQRNAPAKRMQPTIASASRFSGFEGAPAVCHALGCSVNVERSACRKPPRAMATTIEVSQHLEALRALLQEVGPTVAKVSPSAAACLSSRWRRCRPQQALYQRFLLCSRAGPDRAHPVQEGTRNQGKGAALPGCQAGRRGGEPHLAGLGGHVMRAAPCHSPGNDDRSSPIY